MTSPVQIKSLLKSGDVAEAEAQCRKGTPDDAHLSLDLATCRQLHGEENHAFCQALIIAAVAIGEAIAVILLSDKISDAYESMVYCIPYHPSPIESLERCFLGFVAVGMPIFLIGTFLTWCYLGCFQRTAVSRRKMARIAAVALGCLVACPVLAHLLPLGIWQDAAKAFASFGILGLVVIGQAFLGGVGLSWNWKRPEASRFGIARSWLAAVFCLFAAYCFFGFFTTWGAQESRASSQREKEQRGSFHDDFHSIWDAEHAGCEIQGGE